MDELAADLGQVYRGRASEMYLKPDVFMNHSFQTKSLKKVVNAIRNRLIHGEGNSFITLSTPFGGGKTHTMIHAYHAARNMGIKTVVIDGQYDPSATIWSEIEKQLNTKEGKNPDNTPVKHMTMKEAPGKRQIERALQGHESVLILIDELLAYMLTACENVKDDASPARQVLVFIQRLGEVAKQFKKMCVVISYPTNSVISRDRAAQELETDLRSKLNMHAGRTGQSMEPVEYEDVPNVIRRRFFLSNGDDLTNNAKDIIRGYVEKCKCNGLMAANDGEYVKKFEKSYPFVPEVIDVLYHKWGSYPNFHRTRGILQLLGTVLYSFKDSNKKYITLADFNLRFASIKLKFLDCFTSGSYDSVLSTDIAEENSQSNFPHGRECATVIFLMSFGMNLNNPGATSEEIKKAMISHVDHVSIVSDCIEKLRKNLYYLKDDGTRYYFTERANLNQIIDANKSRIDDDMLKQDLKRHLEADGFYVWKKSEDIPDDASLKYVIMGDNDTSKINEIIDYRGVSMRNYKNAIIAICPKDEKRGPVTVAQKDIIARQMVLDDDNLNLDKIAKDALRKRITESETRLRQTISDCYSTTCLPRAENELDIVEIDGGQAGSLKKSIESALLKEERIHSKISPDALWAEILDDRVPTASIYSQLLNSRKYGLRPINSDVIRECIQNGNNRGFFKIFRIAGDGKISILRTPEFMPNEYVTDKDISVSPSGPEQQAPAGRGIQESGGFDDSSIKIAHNDLRIDVKVTDARSLGEVLSIVDGLNFTNGLSVTIKCTGGDFSPEEFRRLDELCKKIDGGAEVQPSV